MAESKFRIWAKTVAIVELVLFQFFVSLFVIQAYFLYFNLTFAFGTCANNEQTAAIIGVILGLLLVTFIIGFITAHIWFSYILLQATHIGADPIEALKKSRRWRIFAFVLFILSLLSLARQIYLPMASILLIFRGLGLLVVHSYIKDVANGEQQSQQPHKITDLDVSTLPPYSQLS